MYLHYMDEETRAWTGEAMYPKSESQRETEVGLKAIRLPPVVPVAFCDHPHTHPIPLWLLQRGATLERAQRAACGLQNAERSSSTDGLRSHSLSSVLRFPLVPSKISLGKLKPASAE